MYDDKTTKELAAMVKRADDAYYSGAGDVMSDAEYDELRAELGRRDPASLERVGFSMKLDIKKVELPVHMGSLDKIRDDPVALERWLSGSPAGGRVLIMDKLDGNSALLVCDHKTGMKLYSRGDGTHGFDISRMLGCVGGIPTALPDVIVRGELIIPKRKNANRSIVAGMMHRKTPGREVKEAGIEFVAYELVGGAAPKAPRLGGAAPKAPRRGSAPNPAMVCYDTSACLDDSNNNVDIVLKQLIKLQELDFEVPFHVAVPASTIDEPYLLSMLLDRKVESAYDIDGLVLADDRSESNDDDTIYTNEKNITANGKNITANGKNITANGKTLAGFGAEPRRGALGAAPPRAAPPRIAYKSLGTSTRFVTRVSEVSWNVSKDGYLKPTVHFETVVIDRVNVSKATGYNAAFIRDNGIGPGARVEVIRSGDVIPRIVRVVERVDPSFPDDEAFEWTASDVDIYVTDAESTTWRRARLLRLVVALHIKGVGPGLVERLYAGGIDTPRKLLHVTEADLMLLDGFQERKAQQVAADVREGLANATLVDVAVASNAFGRGFGARKLGILLQHRHAPIEELNEIDGIGPVSAREFVDGLPRFLEFAAEIGYAIVDGNGDASSSSTLLAGEEFVFSGFRDEALEREIEGHGGSVRSTVTRQCTLLLVAQEQQQGTAKVVKARTLGIPVMARDDFPAWLLLRLNVLKKC